MGAETRDRARDDRSSRQLRIPAGFLLAVSLGFADAASAQGAADVPAPNRQAPGAAHAVGGEHEFAYLQGRLSYRRTTGAGVERGREDWWLTRNRDGSRTMRTLAMTDDSEFVRDATYTIGADERPVLVLIQLQVGSQLVGSGYFRVSGDKMTIVTDAVDTGHTVQVVDVPEKFHVLTHAVMLDGWPTWALDMTQAAGSSQTIAVYTTSPLWNGTSGPLGRMIEQRFTLLGAEDITVPAGTFRARHFRSGDASDTGPASHIWVTGEDNILLKYDWPAYGMEYVLESLTAEAPSE
jgi:hypothetical protein